MIYELTAEACIIRHINLVVCSGGSRGARAPYIWQSQFNFFTLYKCLKKIFLKLNFDFIVAEIRGVFGSVGAVCVCV